MTADTNFVSRLLFFIFRTICFQLLKFRGYNTKNKEKAKNLLQNQNVCVIIPKCCDTVCIIESYFTSSEYKHLVASYLCRGIEEVITGLTRNQFVDNTTRGFESLPLRQRFNLTHSGWIEPFFLAHSETLSEDMPDDGSNGGATNADLITNDYLWASYAFMHESYDDDGESDFNDTSALNTYTYIHEFGHILGADDYYDTAADTSPMEGCDIMDSMLGDHSAFTKINYGWITESRLVVTDDYVTLTLKDFGKTGDTVIIANNWDETLGAYQEYFIVVYYTNLGLNGGDNAGYFARDGVVVYRINSSLYIDSEYEEIYYDIYNNNTAPSEEYGTEDNLIEFVKTQNDTFTYVEGDTLPKVILTSGESLIYTFVVESIDSDGATITFTKVA